MQGILFVGMGGFIGAVLRYALSLPMAKAFGSQFPYGTLLVNVLGGILIGLVMQLSLSTNLVSANLRLFLTTGILGGLTTFSTFSYETLQLLAGGRYGAGSINILLNLLLSLLGVLAGKAMAARS